MAHSRSRAGKVLQVGGALGKADGGTPAGLLGGRAEVQVKEEPRDEDAGHSRAAAGRPRKGGKGEEPAAKVGGTLDRHSAIA